MQKVSLSVDLLNKVLGYLGTKPYQESFQLIEAIKTEAESSYLASQATAQTPATDETVATEVSPTE